MGHQFLFLVSTLHLCFLLVLPFLNPLHSKEGYNHWCPQHIYAVHSLRKRGFIYGPFLVKPCSAEHLQPSLTCVMKKDGMSSLAELGGRLESPSPSSSAVRQLPAGVAELTGCSGWARLGGAASLTASTAAGSCFHRKALAGASSINGRFVTLGRCDVTWREHNGRPCLLPRVSAWGQVRQLEGDPCGTGSARAAPAPGTPWEHLQFYNRIPEPRLMGRTEPKNPVTNPAWGSNKGVVRLPSLILSKIPPILPTLSSILPTPL